MQLSHTLLLAATAISRAYAIAGDHFWTTSPTGELAPEAGYHAEGVACFVPVQGTPGIVTVFRWDNPTSGAHFWTTDPTGEEAPALGYFEEGPAYYVFNVGAVPPAGTVPWYRWAESDGNHFYSTSFAEGSGAGFTFEGVVGYVLQGTTGADIPLFRWAN